MERKRKREINDEARIQGGEGEERGGGVVSRYVIGLLLNQAKKKVGNRGAENKHEHTIFQQEMCRDQRIILFLSFSYPSL